MGIPDLRFVGSAILAVLLPGLPSDSKVRKEALDRDGA